jgi:hypothetical protein
MRFQHQKLPTFRLRVELTSLFRPPRTGEKGNRRWHQFPASFTMHITPGAKFLKIGPLAGTPAHKNTRQGGTPRRPRKNPGMLLRRNNYQPPMAQISHIKKEIQFALSRYAHLHPVRDFGRDIALRCPRPSQRGRNEWPAITDPLVPSPDASLGDGPARRASPTKNIFDIYISHPDENSPAPSACFPICEICAICGQNSASYCINR